MQAATSPNTSYTLPSEILSDIFEKGYDSVSEDDGKLQFVLSIASVCRHWHGISTNLPSLWLYVVIYHFCNPDLLDVWLKRSRNRALNLSILACSTRCVTFDEGEVGGPYWNAVCRVLAPHIARCNNLTISAIEECGPALASLVDFVGSIAMPTLRKLVVVGYDLDDSDDSVKAVQLFAYDTPALTDIRLQNSAAWVCKLPMNHVTELHIAMGEMCLDYVEHFEVLLSSCPLLSTLVLYDSIRISYHGFGWSPPVISVPNLRSLRLYGRSPESYLVNIPFILEQLDAPNLEETHIVPVHKDNLSTRYTAGINHVLRKIKFLTVGIGNINRQEGSFVQASLLFPCVEYLTVPYLCNPDQFSSELISPGVWPCLKHININRIEKEYTTMVLYGLNILRCSSGAPLKRILLDQLSMENVMALGTDVLRDMRADGVEVEETADWNVTWPDRYTTISSAKLIQVDYDSDSV